MLIFRWILRRVKYKELQETTGPTRTEKCVDKEGALGFYSHPSTVLCALREISHFIKPAMVPLCGRDTLLCGGTAQFILIKIVSHPPPRLPYFHPLRAFEWRVLPQRGKLFSRGTDEAVAPSK